MTPRAQAVLAGAALIMLGLLTGCLVFVAVPEGNRQLVTFALGALAGAITVGGAGHLAGSLKSPADPQPPQP